MNFPLPIRVIFAAVVSLLLALTLVVVLYLTDLGFSVWQRLSQAPLWFILFYLLVIGALAGFGGLLVWRLLKPRRQAGRDPQTIKVPSENELRERLQSSENSGIVVTDVRKELDELARRREAGEIFVAFFGEISTGKSSLIKALLPQAEIAIDVRGGTTRDIAYYTWTSPAGDRLTLADLPGLNEADGQVLEQRSRDEAQRAHIVIYVCEGDLSRDQFENLRQLRQLGRPLILAVNKIDRFGDQERLQITQHLNKRLGEALEVVLVQSGGREEITRIYPDGREETSERERPPQVAELRRALQHYIDSDPQALEALRDTSVFVLASQKLDQAIGVYRRDKAENVVQNYTRKAVVGALVAIGPGTDLLIQGYLGVNMLKELCALYEVPVKEVDLQQFLKQASGRVKRHISLLLALAGNVLKAFPGIGTVAGGMLHAVAYGLIFESLGKAVIGSLQSRGELVKGPALRMFEDGLGQNLETRAKRFVELVLARQEQTSHSD